MTTAPTATVAATLTTETPLAELKSFTEAHQIPVTGHKGHKATYLNAIEAFFTPKVEAAVEALQPIAIDTVEPAALAVEAVVVQVHGTVTSPKAINGYQLVLRGAIWIGVGLVLAVGLVYTLAALAWDAIDGEPAIVFWVKRYAKSAQGQELREWLSECRRSLVSIPQSWVEGTSFDQG